MKARAEIGAVWEKLCKSQPRNLNETVHKTSDDELHAISLKSWCINSVWGFELGNMCRIKTEFIIFSRKYKILEVSSKPNVPERVMNICNRAAKESSN